jgi:hypothetical protein
MQVFVELLTVNIWFSKAIATLAAMKVCTNLSAW